MKCMNDLKIVLYKENNTPRTISVNSSIFKKTLFLTSTLSFLLIAALISTFYFYSKSKNAKFAQFTTNQTTEVADDIPIGNTPDEQIRILKDQVELLNQKIKNQSAVISAPKEIEKNSPVLGLFTPNIIDKTKADEKVHPDNFKFTEGTSGKPHTLSFELHNPNPDDGSQKGYILALARSANSVFAYPENSFNPSAPYLVEFDKGETFSIARFRMVNTQFSMPFVPTTIQVLIFTRSGELLFNHLVEVNKNASQ